MAFQLPFLGSFSEAQKKLKEHYSLEVPLSSVQAIVKNHARNVFDFVENDKSKLIGGNTQQLIAEMDGSMIPIIDTMPLPGKCDARRKRTTRRQEARLCFARQANEVTPVFYATLLGDVERSGSLLYRAALRVGLGQQTKVHGVGDGAKWIEDQMRRVFLKQVNYLVDFYHVSEYLAAAAEHSWASEKESWRRECQELLKESKSLEVMQRLRKRLPLEWEEQQVEKTEVEATPVEKCYRYLNNRKNSLDYKDALDRGLPIGSGEIESGHRHIIQKRLKIAGAWWKPETVDCMLSLRLLRANTEWDSYWEYRRKAA